MPPYICRHPDIIYYFYPGDVYNNSCQELFIVCECETMWEYTIVGWAANQVMFIIQHPKVDPDELQWIPQYPRVDAGIDYAVTPPPPYQDCGTSTVTAVWHNEKTCVEMEFLDYDWMGRSFDISQYPQYTPMPGSVLQYPNDPQVWDMYPYIDFDPYEAAHSSGTSKTYAHFVVTEGQSIENEAFKVMYTNSNLQISGDMVEIYGEADCFSGQATISMYAFQIAQEHYPYEPEPDFDVYFISNHEDDVYRYYSRKFYFVTDDDTEIHYYDEDPVIIANMGYIPPGGEPLYSYINPRAPVGAVFDKRSEMAAWKFWDMSPEELHHIYGNYEIYECN
jgi:hypothetical protein